MSQSDVLFTIDTCSAEIIVCPKCECGDRLEFVPMHNGMVYAQCICGYGWDMIGEVIQ